MEIVYQNFKQYKFKLNCLILVIIMFVMVGMGGVVSADSSSGDIPQLTKQGYEYLNSNKLDKAVEVFSKIIEIDPANSSAYTGRGNAYSLKKMYDQSIADFSKAVEIDPNQAWNYAFRGSIYSTKGMTDNAKEDFKLFSKYVNPNDPGLPRFKEYLVKIGYIKNIITVNSDIGNVTINNLLLQGVRNSDVDMVQTAISNGGNVNIYTDNNHYDTPFTIALGKSNLTMINFLINQGADIDVKLSSNQRPLMNAVNSAQALELVPLLIEKGADVNAETQYGATALSYVIGNYNANKAKIVQILVNHGANINHTDNSGKTYLMQAIGNQYALDVVQILLYAGADPNKIDSSGKKALDYAISYNNKELINILLPITQTR